MRSLWLACLCSAGCFVFPIVGEADLSGPSADLPPPPSLDMSDVDLSMAGPDLGSSSIASVQLGQLATGTPGTVTVSLPVAPGKDHLLVAVVMTDAQTTFNNPSNWNVVGTSEGLTCRIHVLEGSADAAVTSWTFTGAGGTTNLTGAVSEWSPAMGLAQSNAGNNLPNNSEFQVSYDPNTGIAGGLVVSAYCQGPAGSTFEIPVAWSPWLRGDIGTAASFGVDYLTALAPSAVAGVESVTTSESTEVFDVAVTFSP